MKRALFITLLTIVPFMICYAQPDEVFEQDSVYCDIWHMKEVSVLPPLKPDMPFDVMVGYTVADTLCRLYDATQLDSIMRTLSNDSILVGVKTFIAMKNYDAFMYESICMKLFLDMPENYKSYYRTVERALFKEYYSRVSQPTQYDSLRDEYYGGIYLVNVGSTSMYLDSVRRKPIESDVAEVYCADLNVILSIYCYNTHFMCGQPTPEDENDCIRVSWFRSPEEYYDGMDSLAVYKLGPGYLEAGKEYLVLLTTWNTVGNEWKYFPKRVFEVVGDSIYDPEGYFRQGVYVSKYDLLSVMHAGINKLAQ